MCPRRWRRGPGCWAQARSNKNDPNDAASVAVAALRFDGLRLVTAVGHAEVLRLLAKRNTEIGGTAPGGERMHSLLMELAAGGIAKEINASDVDRFLAELTPRPRREQVRYDLAVELLDDIRRLDEQLKDSHRRIRDRGRGVGQRPSPTSSGSARSIAATLIGYSGDIDRFANRDGYAAYNGTAPTEFSSGGRTVHRVSLRGSRQLNHALHMAVICQLRHRDSEGRAYFERRVAEGKTKKEAIRALKRQVSNRVYRHLVADAARGSGPGRTNGNDSLASATGSHP